MEEVGEFHVDGSHWARVLHDPVFVHIWGIVVAGGARAHRREKGDQQVISTATQWLYFEFYTDTTLKGHYDASVRIDEHTFILCA